MATEKPIDHLASRLLQTSSDPKVRAVAAAALSDVRPVAHTHGDIASIASHLMQNARSADVRRVAASVLSDRQKR